MLWEGLRAAMRQRWRCSLVGAGGFASAVSPRAMWRAGQKIHAGVAVHGASPPVSRQRGPSLLRRCPAPAPALCRYSAQRGTACTGAPARQRSTPRAPESLVVRRKGSAEAVDVQTPLCRCTVASTPIQHTRRPSSTPHVANSAPLGAHPAHPMRTGTVSVHARESRRCCLSPLCVRSACFRAGLCERPPLRGDAASCTKWFRSGCSRGSRGPPPLGTTTQLVRCMDPACGPSAPRSPASRRLRR